MANAGTTSDYYAITTDPIPSALQGDDSQHSIRTLFDHERLAIEDYLFSRGQKIAINPQDTAVVIPHDRTAGAALDEFGILVEFALGVLAISGFQAVSLVATLNQSRCTDARSLPLPAGAGPAVFPRRLNGPAAAAWLRHLFSVRRKTKDRLHITADRFVRYARAGTGPDALLDLCICLESLIEGDTEISFRFSTCLAKVGGRGAAEATSDLLKDLYDLRCKLVHGADFSRQHGKVSPNAAKLRQAARAILSAYVLYLTEHSKEDWKKHLRSSLLA